MSNEIEKRKIIVECYGCSGEFTLIYNPNTDVVSYCPFCGDDLNVEERPELLQSIEDDEDFEKD